MKALGGYVGGVLIAIVCLLLLAGIHDGLKSAIYGGDEVNREQVNAMRNLDYTDVVAHQRAADDAALEAAEEQSKADEARGRMQSEH